MDETIDLRPYVEAVLRRWWVILGAVVVGVLVAVVLFFSQLNYKAVALVAVTDPTQRLQFDPRIVTTIDLDVLLQAYPELAMSDAVLSTLLEEAYTISGGQIDSMATLRDMIDVESGVDPRLVRLVVQADDPQLAADLVNAWAVAFVDVVDTIYGAPGGEVEFFRNQLAGTEGQLQAAESALVEFQSGSRMGIVDNQLNSLNDLQATYLADQRRLGLVLDDIRSLRRQIEGGTGDAITWADQLTALLLQLTVYETPQATPSPSNAIQLQTNAETALTTTNRSDQLTLLDNLAQATEASRNEIAVKLLELEPQIFELQREKQDLFHQFEELSRNRDVASETYITLARKIDEARIQADDSDSSLKVASLAVPPTEMERPNLIITTAIAGLAGLLLSAAAILAVTWWRTARQPVA
ncbi:protein of unknown function [Candidatus Promineifilum breve]|uniref:Polysaccharide chain length determinant N-terminal domain-containing protein n=1 Tax=Candidatus Promineifilum breve TaxID=1806508 RepID=A0A161KB35_9CHLR|nr:Wzz/FepE/Etk N-terminal domain-containing protein [Candidatus Promineifilum breve]CUS05033.2 protein of unknown function [Candidatus Promineifilum breve]